MFNYAYTFFLLGILALVVLPLSFLFKSEKPTSLNIRRRLRVTHSTCCIFLILRKAIIDSSVILLARDTYTTFFPNGWNFNILSTGGVNFSINITSFSPSVLTYNRIGWSVAN